MTQGTVVIFWDYDTQWGADRSRAGIGPRTWGSLEFSNTERLLEVHAEFGIPACFAVVAAASTAGSRPYHDPRQIREIHAAGHEVASHSLTHEWIPGLDEPELRTMLAQSKGLLEQCIGAPVEAFVPPWNQPTDYSRKLSFSFSERTTAGSQRTDLGRLLRVLQETGYRFARVSYRPLSQRLAERLAGRRLDRPAKPGLAHGVRYLRLNTPGGFHAPVLDMLERCVQLGGATVAYGHPHSLLGEGAQNVIYLRTFLTRVAELRDQGKLRVLLPRQIVRNGAEQFGLAENSHG